MSDIKHEPLYKNKPEIQKCNVKQVCNVAVRFPVVFPVNKKQIHDRISAVIWDTVLQELGQSGFIKKACRQVTPLLSHDENIPHGTGLMFVPGLEWTTHECALMFWDCPELEKPLH